MLDRQGASQAQGRAGRKSSPRRLKPTKLCLLYLYRDRKTMKSLKVPERAEIGLIIARKAVSRRTRRL